MTKEIFCTIQIDRQPSEVYSAIASDKHIRNWWTSDCSIAPEKESVGVFHWRDHGWKVEMRIEDLQKDSLIKWQCVNSNMQNTDAWEGSTLTFEIEPSANGSTLKFSQTGYRSSPCYDVCNEGWNFVLGKSLKSYLEKGQGHPYVAKNSDKTTHLELRKEIILIGVAVGKTTVSKLLAQRLGLPRVSMDDTLFTYMAEVGFDEAHWKTIMEKQGKPGGYRYLRVFGSHAVKRLLEDHKNCVFDFGSGGVMGEFPDEFARIKEELVQFENVVFLIPAKDKKESLEYLYDRLNIKTQAWTILEHLVFHSSHEELAKHIVYVKNRTPEEVCELILQIPSVASALNSSSLSEATL